MIIGSLVWQMEEFRLLCDEINQQLFPVRHNER